MYRLELIKSADDFQIWNEFVLKNKGEKLVTISHNPTLMNVLIETFGYKNGYYFIIRNENIVGVLPGVYFKSKYISLPHFTYGGIFGEIELDQSVNIFKSLSDFDWEIRSFYDYSYYTNDNKITCLLELKKTEEEQWSSFKSKLRSQIKSGQKHPLEVFHGGIELLPDFYHLYTRNMFRLGSPPLPILFFKNIFKFFGLGEALITLVRLNNKPVAAGFMLSYINFNEVCWASSDIEFNKFNVNMVLYWEMIKVSISKGNGIFSFGRSSKNSSTLKFKLQWGCNVEQIYMNNSNKKTLDVRNISVLAKLWKLQTLKTSIYFGKYIAKFVY